MTQLMNHSCMSAGCYVIF